MYCLLPPPAADLSADTGEFDERTAGPESARPLTSRVDALDLEAGELLQLPLPTCDALPPAPEDPVAVTVATDAPDQRLVRSLGRSCMMFCLLNATQCKRRWERRAGRGRRASDVRQVLRPDEQSVEEAWASHGSYDPE